MKNEMKLLIICSIIYAVTAYEIKTQLEDHKLNMTVVFENSGTIYVYPKWSYLINCTLEIINRNRVDFIQKNNVRKCVLDSEFLSGSGTYLLEVSSSLKEDTIMIKSESFVPDESTFIAILIIFVLFYVMMYKLTQHNSKKKS